MRIDIAVAGDRTRTKKDDVVIGTRVMRNWTTVSPFAGFTPVLGATYRLEDVTVSDCCVRDHVRILARQMHAVADVERRCNTYFVRWS